MKRQEFSTKIKLQAWERANGRCEKCCKLELFPGNIAFDHIVPCALGGEPVLSNCSCCCRFRGWRRFDGSIVHARER